MPKPTIRQILQIATQQLDASSDTPRLDAEVLLTFVLQKPRSYLMTWPDRQPSDRESAQFDALLQQRLIGHPVAHLTGEREFWSLPIKVTTDTLIPRPDTELLVELALQRLPANARVLELGTGTGAISLALASERPDLQITACDLSPTALEVATENAKSLSISTIHFLLSDWYQSIPVGEFKLILSNPPYICADDPHLQQGDLRFEPKSALISGENGLIDLEKIISGAVDRLTPSGWLLLEHGYQQAAKVRQIMADYRFTEITSEQDLGKQERVTLSKR